MPVRRDCELFYDRKYLGQNGSQFCGDLGEFLLLGLAGSLNNELGFGFLHG